MSDFARLLEHAQRLTTFATGAGVTLVIDVPEAGALAVTLETQHPSLSQGGAYMIVTTQKGSIPDGASFLYAGTSTLLLDTPATKKMNNESAVVVPYLPVAPT